mgnify:CR=1 FL=1
MPIWLKWPGLPKIRLPKEKLMNIYLELCPDNRINSFMVTPYRPQDADPFMEYLRHSARKAMKEGNGTIPDNLLLSFNGIPEKQLPPPEALLEGKPEKAWRFMLECGGITGENSVPLRKAVYLEAQGREMNRENLQAVGHSSAYRNYEAYETAMAKISEGKNARFRLTFVKTEHGVRVFNDGLHGPGWLRGLLQETADRFYSPACERVKTLSIYRIETSSRRLLEMSRETGRDFPLSQPGLELLAGYLPAVSFDMSPTAANLNRFVAANSLALSGYNLEIMTLQDIADKGYAHLYMDGAFRYKKEFSCIEKGFRTLAREKEYYREFPFEEMACKIQEKAKELAEFLLKKEGIRRDIPPMNPDMEKYAGRIRLKMEHPEEKERCSTNTGKKRNSSSKRQSNRKKQVKPQL